LAAKHVVGFVSPSVAHIPSDVQLMLPDGASVIIATLSNRNGAPGAEERAFAALENAIDALVYEGAQSIIVFGIPSAARTGFAEERRAYGALSAAKGVPIVSSLWVSLRKLQAAGVRRALAITQYNDGVNARILTYAADAGVDIIAAVGLGASNADQVNAITPADYGTLAVKALAEHPGADGIFLAARGRLLAVAQELEARSGLPVVHHQQAALWWAIDDVARI
jgi:maleate cis-trans isomerase